MIGKIIALTMLAVTASSLLPLSVVWADDADQDTVAVPPYIEAGVFPMMPEFLSDEVIKDAPVTARLTTRSVQRLYDGNRIVQEEITMLYRDSAGQIRREHQQTNGGPLIILSNLDDGAGYILDSEQKMAMKLPSASEVFSTFSADEMDSWDATMDPGVTPLVVTDSPLFGGIVLESGAMMASENDLSAAMFDPFGGVQSGHKEVKPLGQDTLEGIRVEGTKYTTTIDANTVGNEKPIVVERTTWFSPELRIMVRSEESDPRFGTLTYTAKILSTQEPNQSLFSLPSDFAVLSSDGTLRPD